MAESLTVKENQPGLDVVNDDRIRESVTKLARQQADEGLIIDVDAKE